MKITEIDLERWKQFSDFLDILKETITERLSKESILCWKVEAICQLPFLQKTIENFYEWECGKLTMDKADEIIKWALPKKRKKGWRN